MNKKLVLLLSTVWLSLSGHAQTNTTLSMLSPKLREFLAAHAAASHGLNTALAEAFVNRKVHIFYFYTDNDTADRAYHMYPSADRVVVAVRENQEPADEFICLFFELLNSTNEKSFEALFRKASAGELSREAFANEVLKLEFKSLIKTRDLLGSFKFKKSEIQTSYEYDHFLKCPDKFEDFTAYAKTLNPQRDVFKEYESKYDLLRKQ